MSQQTVKSFKSCKNNKQVVISPIWQGKVAEWNWYFKADGSSKHFEALRVFSRSEKILPGDRVSDWLHIPLT